MEKGGKEFDNKGKDRERVRKEKSAEKGLEKGKKNRMTEGEKRKEMYLKNL